MIDKENVKEGQKKVKQSRRDREQLLRIEELEKLMAATHGEVDPETIVSMYIPRRKARRLGAALLRLGKLWWILLGVILMIVVIYIFAFVQEKIGNFTINLNRLELYRKGISIAADGDFTDATARLTASNVKEATNISIHDLPDDLDDHEGEHNGTNYLAYTFFLRNAGKESVDYKAVLSIRSCAKGAEKATRIALWRNGERQVYAAPAANGEPEDGCVSFEDDKIICRLFVPEFNVGYVDKYTVCIWLEGDDPECVDEIIGGSVEFTMDFEAISEDDRSLFEKYLQDIGDTLQDDKPISAAGNDAPSYFRDQEITWSNRLNK